MYSNRCTIRLRIVGFPIRKSSDIMFTYNSPKHIGVSPVLHRLLVPWHSPCALVHLTKLYFYRYFDLMSFYYCSYLVFKVEILHRTNVYGMGRKRFTLSKLNEQS